MSTIVKDSINQAYSQARQLVEDGFHRAIAAGALKDAPLPAFVVEIPADPTKGDFATNAAMAGAKAFSMAPRQIAQILCEQMNLEGTPFQRVEVAGPGFINFFVGAGWFSTIVESILALGDQYGRTDYGHGEKINVEFVSANPTGPMHMGNARGGAIGDCLAAVLDWAGYQVSREFYVNDAGNQIAKFGLSLEARYLQIYQGEEAVPFPEDGYHGDDIRVHAENFSKEYGDRYVNAPAEERRQALVDFALPRNLAQMKADLAKYRIHYDTWFLESTLHPDAINQVLKTLADRGLTYEKEGAVWYKATQFGDEKDEVLVRANGVPTYFAADIAYHYNKFAVRGFERCINVWGADHHGHVARLKGAMDAIGLDGSKLDIVLMQLVRLMKDGTPVKMSKRTGKAISLADLFEEVPVDAARFFFNLREPNSTLDFDLGLAAQQTSQNPVYYVQYAHARICSILRRMEQDGVAVRPCTREELDLLTTGDERNLIRQLGQLPATIIDSARRYDPAAITKYLVDLANLFHKFYTTCSCRCDDEHLMQARLNLCLAVKTVLANALGMLQVSCPDSM